MSFTFYRSVTRYSPNNIARKPSLTKLNMNYDYKYNFRVFIFFVCTLLFWRSNKSLLNLVDLKNVDPLQYRSATETRLVRSYWMP